MSRNTYLLGALLLLLPFMACDRKYEPGVDHYIDTFASAPYATSQDMYRDSISNGQQVYTPVGTTSGARSVAEARSSMPYGNQNTSEYTESGTTDGTSTTSGRSLTNRGRTDSEVPGTTSGPEVGTTGGRGSLNNAPRNVDQKAGSRAQLGDTSPKSTAENENTNKSNNN